MTRHFSGRTRFKSALAAIVAALALIGWPNAGFAAPPAPQTEEVAGPPVTVVVTRFVKRGCEARFEALWRDMVPVRNAFPGHLGSDFIVPVGAGDSSYHMLYRFDSASHHQAWLRSPERAAWLRRLDALTLGAPQYRYENGLGAWVALPERQGMAPEKYKTTVVTWLAIFPLVAGVASATSAVTAPLFGPLPFLVNTAIVTGLVVPALSYVVMPPLTWAFRDWLYPPDTVCQVSEAGSR